MSVAGGVIIRVKRILARVMRVERASFGGVPPTLAALCGVPPTLAALVQNVNS